MSTNIPKPLSLFGYPSGVGWFSGVRSVWLHTPHGNLKTNCLTWTDHNGYDKGMIRGCAQGDVVRVLNEVFG